MFAKEENEGPRPTPKYMGARACSGFFIGGKTEGPMAESGGGVLGRGQLATPSPPARGFRRALYW